MEHVLIDTDVLLDFLFDREPFSDASTRVFTLCEKGEIKGSLTAVAISNAYYIMRKHEKHDRVLEHLKLLLSIVDIAVTNKTVLLNAMHSDFKDFEDAIQNYSATYDSSIKTLLTRNVKDYKNSSLTIMTPEIFIQTIKH